MTKSPYIEEVIDDSSADAIETVRVETAAEPRRESTLFQLFPDLIPELRKLTLGGQRIFDDFGNLSECKKSELDAA